MAIAVGIAGANETGLCTLTFAERVAAQEAIERVHHAHQLGTTKPFEDAVPRPVLEAKVRRYVDWTAALEASSGVVVSDEMLDRELARMVAGSKMPERLRELFLALGNDPLLLRECLARPALVDRMSRRIVPPPSPSPSSASISCSADAWTPTSTTGAPGERFEHTRSGRETS